MAEVSLKVSKAAYENQIGILQGYLTQLDTTISQYERKETELDSFMGGRDDNYENMRAGIQHNIATVRKAREMCEASIQSLQETLSAMEDFGSNMASTIQNGVEAARTGVKAAFDVMNLID